MEYVDSLNHGMIYVNATHEKKPLTLSSLTHQSKARTNKKNPKKFKIRFGLNVKKTSCEIEF